MKKYKVIIPEMEYEVEADDEDHAEIQVVGLFDWGNVDFETDEIEGE